MESFPSPASEKRRRLALWVAHEVLPHEARVRALLTRSSIAPDELDEVIQEAYCRLAMLDSVEHIDSPSAYFFSIARNLLIRRLKRQQIVPLKTIAEIDAYEDDRPSPERSAGGKLAYGKVLNMIADLPDRCRKVVQLRKIEGWSQKQIADHLGTTEKAVEKQIWLGVRMIREAWSRSEQDTSSRLARLEKREGGQ